MISQARYEKQGHFRLFLSKQIKTLSFGLVLLFNLYVFQWFLPIIHKNQMSLSTDIISRTVRTQKNFNFEPGKCIYVNIQTSRKNQKKDAEPVIKILNTVCKESGGHLTKVTQIRFKEKLIVIEDQYMFRCRPENAESNGDKTSSQPTKSSDGSNHSNPLYQEMHKSLMPIHKKKLIFKKKYLEDNARMEKRNTKNIAKNFCKAFINYLQQKENVMATNKAKQLMSYYNYNNKTIQALGKDSLTNEQFKQFLKNRALDWVQSSKIYDKKIHKQAIPLYLSLIDNQNGYNPQGSNYSSTKINRNGIGNSHETNEICMEGNGNRNQQNIGNHNGNDNQNQNEIQDENQNINGRSNSVYESDQLFQEEIHSSNHANQSR